MRQIRIFQDSFPLKVPFRISRGVKTAAELIRVEIEQDGKTGEGECCPYGRYGETLDSVQAEIEAAATDIENGMSREKLQSLLPPGAARNALDCALWDLEVKKTGKPLSELIGLKPAECFKIMRTIGLDTPEKMAADAKAYPPGVPLKVKLGHEDVATRLIAIRGAAPKADIIIDANEAWTPEFLDEYFPILKRLGVTLLEQPLPAGKDEALQDMDRMVPVCADESCHTMDDLPAFKGRYDAVNIKLDKTGGLTAALALYHAARRDGFLVMLGCMVSTSLSIAPMTYLCSDADFIDLDAPLFLKGDRSGGMTEIKDTENVQLNASWGRP